MNYTKQQLSALVFLRVLIGWHFLYEGLVKVTNPNWSALPFLRDSRGIFSPIFHTIADSNGLLQLVNFLNEWGLILIGICLIAGLFTKIVTVGGVILLTLYYLSHPPFVGLEYATPSEGSYLIVNKTLIELAALLVLRFFPSSDVYGLDSIIFKKIKRSFLLS